MELCFFLKSLKNEIFNSTSASENSNTGQNRYHPESNPEREYAVNK